MEGIVASTITGFLALIGVIITNMMSSKAIENKLAIAQAVSETRLSALTEEVRKHNEFVTKMPVVEEQIKVINHRIDDLESITGGGK